MLGLCHDLQTSVWLFFFNVGFYVGTSSLHDKLSGHCNCWFLFMLGVLYIPMVFSHGIKDVGEFPIISIYDNRQSKASTSKAITLITGIFRLFKGTVNMVYVNF